MSDSTDSPPRPICLGPQSQQPRHVSECPIFVRRGSSTSTATSSLSASILFRLLYRGVNLATHRRFHFPPELVHLIVSFASKLCPECNIFHLANCSASDPCSNLLPIKEKHLSIKDCDIQMIDIDPLVPEQLDLAFRCVSDSCNRNHQMDSRFSVSSSTSSLNDSTARSSVASQERRFNARTGEAQWSRLMSSTAPAKKTVDIPFKSADSRFGITSLFSSFGKGLNK
ncbi:hypothetical protein BCR33DRAFT_786963 [Rhizoclosmatium globosum]|uniref:Uncharacterized protein n=1 Tax=Rhizoclosmatium globosum TaxID=329046 RepID=A0A1Y2C2L9_9FUNG|nr:hypothetical protein BCR33DRAFT_786963 [Rhizoclosmatium globosum]|eukprot:ORY41206.1 hypothetical protein BCR33DRAFT_786963 [Rhizoclosmatium globosum]